MNIFLVKINTFYLKTPSAIVRRELCGYIDVGDGCNIQDIGDGRFHQHRCRYGVVLILMVRDSWMFQ